MSELKRIAGVQMDVALGEKERNLEAMLGWLDRAARAGASLVVFPECALTGYCFESREEAIPHAEPIPGPATQAISEACQNAGVHAVLGMLELDGDRIFNAAALCGPTGLIGNYRKVHLPWLGVDRFTTPGDRPFAVHDLGDLRVGLHICYDCSFPEAARVMSLAGADLLVLPTNFPPGAACMVEHVVHARAMENAVYFAAVNRVGTEGGFQFIGQSKICGPDGKLLAAADPDEESMLLADVDPTQARQKRRIRVPGKHEIDRFADRRPEFYSPVADTHLPPTPARSRDD